MNFTESEGWWYYDNKWRDGKKSDGWGKYTRRRKWVRRAELVEVEMETGEEPYKVAGEEEDEREEEGGEGAPEIRVCDVDAGEGDEDDDPEGPPRRKPPPLPGR